MEKGSKITKGASSANLGAHSNSDLRGDYADAREDFIVSQNWDDYTAEDHETWRHLYEQQSGVLEGRACRAYLEMLEGLDCASGIPRFDRLSERLERATGWSLVAVPGFIPDEVFFGHLAARRFPVTRWIRRKDELDYLVEPDVFHDCFGHVPLIADPVFADFLQAYGALGLEAKNNDELAKLARLYWYTVEFGLMREEGALRVFGAGILSSRSETLHALESDKPNRVAFNAARIMRTRYEIDAFQKTYFVIDGFDQLFDAAASLDLAHVEADLASDQTLASDQRIEI